MNLRFLQSFHLCATKQSVIYVCMTPGFQNQRLFVFSTALRHDVCTRRAQEHKTDLCGFPPPPQIVTTVGGRGACTALGSYVPTK